MGLKDIDIKVEYRSLKDNIAKDFYIPLLKEAKIYKRAVGYFSSSALLEISLGINKLVSQGGKIKIIASPHLTSDDILAISEGYKNRKEVIEDALIRELKPTKNLFEKECMNLLANLIGENVLDIKIAFVENSSRFGMYHEKLGIIEDCECNKVVFTGSMNETYNAMTQNYESIDVFCSWKDRERVEIKDEAFDRIWYDEEESISSSMFPMVKEKIVETYLIDEDINLNKVDEMWGDQINFFNKIDSKVKSIEKNAPTIPESVRLRDYQVEAINNWEENNCRGIFDMATGTGKTFTGLGAVVRLYEKLNGKLAVIIVCPYQHLVEQWIEDLRMFNIEPVVGYSASTQKNWKDRLRNSIFLYNASKDKEDDFFCFICTNATFSSSYVKRSLTRLNDNVLLMIDEAHNFGAKNLSKSLNDKYQFRLALSATFDRHEDEEGTSVLYRYFDKKCIEYGLKKAIDEGKLTPYYYYPIVIKLTDIEMQDYDSLTLEISKNVRIGKSGKKYLTEAGKILTIKRARIVAGALDKLSKLKEYMEMYKEDNNILVYCGSTSIDLEYENLEKYNNKEYCEAVSLNNQIDLDGSRQIDLVASILGNDLGMSVAKFTSQESMADRKIILDRFKRQKDCQALIAIKCLDEGVNIPSVRTAFILASTTNPKEYIQRRGRVLRLHYDKEYANIYDFIVVTAEYGNNTFMPNSEMKIGKSLVKSEIKRFEEFNSISLNRSDNIDLFYKIKDTYEIYDTEEEAFNDD